MIKRVAFVRRRSGVEPASWVQSWRAHEEHRLAGLAGDSLPNRLVLCVVRDRRGDAPHHGVAIAWFPSTAALEAFAGPASAPTPRPVVEDSAPPVIVEERCAFGDEWIEDRWRRAEESALLLLGFIQRAPHLSRSQFADYWWSEHRPLANAVLPPELQPTAYVHNYVLDGQPGAWDGIGEMYETSLDAPRQRGEWLEQPEIVADEERFLVRSTRMLLVTDQHVIVAGD